MADVALRTRVRGPDDSESTTAALWTRISGRIDLRLRLVERVAVTLLDRALVDGEADEAAMESVVLAQWLGVLQLSGAATLCRQIATLLSDDDLDAASGLQIAALLDDLRVVIHAASAEMSTRAPGAARVRVISPITVELDSMMWLLSRRGLRVEHDTSLVGDLSGVNVLMTTSEHSPTLAYTTLALGRERRESIQRITIHADEPIDVQCQLARVSDLLLPASMPTDVMADEIQRFVLACLTDDDEVTVLGSSQIAKTLKLYGMPTRATTTVQDAVESLEAGSRTLVIGGRTPAAMAAGLVSLVRARPHLRDVVIAVSDFDEMTDRTLRRGGVDLVVPPNSDPDGWAAHLKALRAHRRQQAEVLGDPAATILPWPRASVLLERALVVSRRLDSHAALAIIEFDERVGSDGEPSSERVSDALATEFRLDDVVGRWDSRRIVVLLRGAGRRAAVARIAGALKRLDLEEGSRAGIAEFPVDGSTLPDLLDVGVRTIETARDGHGPLVASTDWRPDSERAADIVLVEADPALAGVLKSLFERRGHTTHHMTSGVDALSYFTGSNASPPPNLLVLEMDAPGADGLMVLRALRRHGVMAHLRVLLTCTRVRDGELQEAYELGALDVVVKPYSAVVLTQRVNRLLES